MRRTISAWAWCVMVGCAGGEDTDAPVDPETGRLTWDVRERGPWGVGYRFETLVYTTPDGRTREVGLGMWYPTDATTGGEVVYTDGFPTPLDGILADAPPAEPDLAAGFPVVVHSHGHQATNGSGQPVGAWMASHGWVTAAPDHVPDTFSTIFGGESTPPEHWIDRPSDLSAALDHLGALPSDHPLAGRVDATAAMATGHSRGVTTVWSVLGDAMDPGAIDRMCPGCGEAALAELREGQDDPRVVAGVGLAGSRGDDMFGSGATTGVAEPYLQLVGSANPVGEDAQYASVQDVAITGVSLEGGCHESFASGLPCPGLDTDLGFSFVGMYTLAFARVHVLGDDDATALGLLDGSVIPDPIVAWSEHGLAR